MVTSTLKRCELRNGLNSEHCGNIGMLIKNYKSTHPGSYRGVYGP